MISAKGKHNDHHRKDSVDAYESDEGYDNTVVWRRYLWYLGAGRRNLNETIIQMNWQIEEVKHKRN